MISYTAVKSKVRVFSVGLILSMGSFCTAITASFQGIGDFPGGDYESICASISPDGSVVVGTSKSTNGREAFYWKEGLGKQGLGDLPGGEIKSYGGDVSKFGSVIVGRSDSSSGPEAYYYTQSEGMVGLGDFSGGIFYSSAQGISEDGTTVVGYGNHDQGTEAFRWTKSEGMVGLSDLPGGDYRKVLPDVGPAYHAAARERLDFGGPPRVWA